MKLQTNESSLFIGQSYFGNNGSQNFLIFQLINKTLTTFAGLPDTIVEWESTGLSNEKINPHFTEQIVVFPPKLVWKNNSRIEVEFKGSSLKQDKVTFTPNNVVNLLIVCELDRWSQDLNSDFTVEDCLFGVVKLTKNADPDNILI